MKKFLLSVFTLFVCSVAYPQAVNVNLAKSYAEQWLVSAGQKFLTDLDCVYTQSNEEKSLDYFHVFSSKSNNTFIIISADERILPVLAYSDEAFFDPDNIPSNMQGWLEGYVDEMNYVFTLENAQKHPDWDNILEGNITKGAKGVTPLINLLWNQDSPYNYYAPQHPTGQGPGGKCYAGCVAAAMAMIMKFWNFPVHGLGSRSYNFPPYGIITANFEEEFYQWNQMPIQATYSNYDAIAKLMFHCGVSVSMQWGGYPEGGSAAYTAEVANALKKYFGYKTQCTHKDKSSYDPNVWENMMKAELDLGRPMEYHGRSTSSGGHAFVLDGYNESNLFHFNWGWSGAGNGYYNLSNLNPTGYNFNDQQGAVMNIEPREDLFCNPPRNLIGSIDGTTVTLTWDAPEPSELTLTGYEVHKNGTNVITITSTSYEETSVGFGEYEYCIVACYNNGCKTTPICTTISNTTCYPPTELIAFVEVTNVTLLWNEPEMLNGLSKYKIYRDDEYLAEANVPQYTDENVPFGIYNYCVTAIYGTNHESESTCTEVEVQDTTTGITAIYHDDIKIYPNPAKTNVNIKAANITEVSIINSIGRAMKTIQISANELTLDIADFPKGIYILKINTQDHAPLYRKFMISD